MERFIQPASGKPDPDPVLISAYVPNTRPTQIFSVRSTPKIIKADVESLIFDLKRDENVTFWM